MVEHTPLEMTRLTGPPSPNKDMRAQTHCVSPKRGDRSDVHGCNVRAPGPELRRSAFAGGGGDPVFFDVDVPKELFSNGSQKGMCACGSVVKFYFCVTRAIRLPSRP